MKEEEKKGVQIPQQEEEKKELIKKLESTSLEETHQPLLVQHEQDPILAVERDLKVKLDQDTKEILKEMAATETSYQAKVRKMLDYLKKSKYSENRKVLKNIDTVEPLYDIHDFWDTQPVPKAYDKIDDSMYDQPIDVPKTLADVK